MSRRSNILWWIIGQLNKSYARLSSFYVTRDRIPLSNILREFLKEVKNDDIQSKAQAMAFNFILAVFPGIIFLFTLIPYVPIDHFSDKILFFLAESMPTNVYELMAGTITDVVQKPKTGLLSLGFILCACAAINGTVCMINSFDKCYSRNSGRGFWGTRWVATQITFILILFIMASIFILNTSELYIHGFAEFSNLLIFEKAIVLWLRNSMLLILLLSSISIIYYWAPSDRTEFSFFSHGSIIATAINTLVSLLFSIYINNFASYNKLYGSIGTIIGMLLMFYLISLSLLVGYEINASIDVLKIQKKNARFK